MVLKVDPRVICHQILGKTGGKLGTAPQSPSFEPDNQHHFKDFWGEIQSQPRHSYFPPKVAKARSECESAMTRGELLANRVMHAFSDYVVSNRNTREVDKILRMLMGAA